jgi:hypothetical protein
MTKVAVTYITRFDWPTYDPVTDEYVALTKRGGEIRRKTWLEAAEQKRLIDRDYEDKEQDYHDEMVQARRPL